MGETRPRYHGALTIPNAISLLRLLAVPVFLYLSSLGEFKLAFFLIVAAALTDALDGWLARKLNQRSAFGAILDPAADKVMVVLGYLMYTLDPGIPYRLPVWLTFTIFTRDITIVFFAYLLYTRIQVKRFPPTISGKISTVVQALTLAAIVAVNAFPALGSRPIEILFRVALIAALYSAFDYLRRADLMLNSGS